MKARSACPRSTALKPALCARSAFASDDNLITILSGKPSGLATLDHTRKYGIANQRECPFRHVALDHVRARRRHRTPTQIAVRRAGRDRRPPGQTSQEVAIGSSQVEDDRAGRVVRADALAEVAMARSPLACIGPDKRREILGGPRAPAEGSLERAQEVAGLDERPVRIADARGGAGMQYVVSPSVIAGSDVARSGTICVPSFPPRRAKSTRPS